MPLLKLKNIEICYSHKPVVKNISFSLEEGEILGIVGESGSGKSTIIKAVMGLLDVDGAVTKGEILYKDQSVLGLSGENLRKLRGPEMGMIFQDCSSSLCPIRKIGDQLFESISQHQKTTKDEMKKQAGELMEKIHLQDSERILNSYPFELSGGMNQRVGIVMAMLLRPSLLFADEPTSALDVTVQAQVVEEMMRMREIYHTSIVIVTHNIGVISRMADKVAVMYQGQLEEYGTVDEVIHHPQKEYTKRLLAAVPRIRKH